MKSKSKGWCVTTHGAFGFFERKVYFQKKSRAKEFAKRERAAGKKARITRY
jgi:hypothetical protein